MKFWNIIGEKVTGVYKSFIPAEQPSSSGYFGWSVAMSADGGRVAIGAPGTIKPSSVAMGAVFIYNGAGQLLYSIYHPDSSLNGRFGNIVSMSADGSKLLITAQSSQKGWLYNALTGTLIGAISNPETVGNGFGANAVISPDGSKFAIAAPSQAYGGYSYTGTVYVYNSGSFSVPTLTIRNPELAASDYFGGGQSGNSLAMSYDASRIIIGAPQDDYSGTDTGSAYVFNGSTGGLITAIRNPAPTVSSDYFGYAVALSQDGMFAIVGAPRDGTGGSNAGSAYFYNATTGQLLYTINYPTATSTFGSGIHITKNNQQILISAPLANGFRGIINVYDLQTRALLGTIVNPVAGNQGFGDNYSIAANGDGSRVAIGALYYNAPVAQAGATWIF